MGLQITVITSVSLVLVAMITAFGTIYAARLNRKVQSVTEAVHTANGDTLGAIVENISAKQDEVKRTLEAGQGPTVQP